MKNIERAKTHLVQGKTLVFLKLKFFGIIILMIIIYKGNFLMHWSTESLYYITYYPKKQVTLGKSLVPFKYQML